MSLAGAICFSTKAVFVKLTYATGHDVDPVTLLALRMIFSLPFFAVSAAFTSQQKDNKKFTSRQWVSVALVGMMGYYVSSYLDFLGLQYVSAGIERLILFTFPTFVLIISAVLLKKPAQPMQWTAVGLTYIGLLVAFGAEARINTEPEFFLGSAYIFVCAITFAIYVAASGQLIPVVGAVKFNSYAMSFAAIAVLIHFLVSSDQSLLGLPTVVYLYALAMALVGTVLPSYLVSLGIKRLGSNVTAVIASIGPVSTIIQAHYFLGESFSWLQAMGTLFILAGVLLISWKPATKDVVGDLHPAPEAAGAAILPVEGGNPPVR
jgi:drug/metabolite transporter (DMT)-like permease